MQLKLSHKLLIITAVPLAFILALLLAVDQMHDRVQTAEYYAARSELVIVQAQALSRQLLRAESGIRGYALTGDSRLAEPYQEAAVEIPDAADRLKQLVSENPEQEGEAADLALLANKILGALSAVRISFDASAHNRPHVQAAVLAAAQLNDAFFNHMERFIADERRLSTVRETELQNAWYEFHILVVAGAIAACLLTLALMFVFSRTMVRRLSMLSQEAERFASSGEVGPSLGGQDEVAQVDEAFHAMAAVLRERQAALSMYKLLAQNARDGMVFLRRSDGRIVEANEAALSMFGYTRDEMLQLSVRDLRHPSKMDSLDSGFAAAEKGVAYETLDRRKDGSAFPVEVHPQVAIVRGERLILAIVRDITEPKRLERERQRYFDLSTDPMCVAHVGGRLIRQNPALSRTLGFAPNDPLATSLLDFIHPDDHPQMVRALRRLANDEGVDALEVRCRCKDGSYKSIQWHAVPAGEDGLFYAAGRDVTEQKAGERALADARDKATDASRLKSQFLANMSHEIRTPMNGVIGMTELLLSTPLSRDQCEYATAIRESGAALLAIINEILDFSKLEAGKLELEIAEFSPTAVAESVADLLASQARQKSLAVQSFVAPDVPRSLRGDPGRVRQILINLVGNAIKFTDSGRVTVRVTNEAEKGNAVTLKFSVSDTGIGIPESARARLFQPFVQADGSSTRYAGGTGLGLSICKRLVELMQGSIGFESEQGKGSTFTFTAQFAKSAVASAEPPRTELRGHRALIVDDDPIAREIISAYVASWGMRSESVAGGADALDALRKAVATGEPYDIAIVDFWMPQMNGLTLARSIRSDNALSSTKLILMTAFDANLHRNEASRAGFAAYLTKPVKQSQLFMSISSAIRHGNADVPDPSAAATILEQFEPRPSPHVASARILLAEDNAINQKLAVAQLKRLGLAADVVKNGQEAVDAIKAGDFALVLMDCQMPGMDGFEATRMVRASEVGSRKHTTIIAITANALEGDREICVAAGMDDYLSKPVQLEALQALVQRWLPGFGKATASA